MPTDQPDRDVPSTGHAGIHALTPDSATWDTREDAEVELLGDADHIDEVDLVDENWAPGQLPPGVPVDEVLHIHSMMNRAPTADELDVNEVTHDRLELAADELFEGEEER